MVRTSGSIGGVSIAGLKRSAVLPHRRLPHVVTAIGDSRIAAIYVDSADGFAIGGGSALNWANALLEQRLVIGRTFGRSGDRTDQMLARLDDAIATNAGLLYVMGGANDIGGNYPTLETSGAHAFGNLRTIIERATAAGMIVVCELETGFNNYPAVRVAQVRELNARLAELAETTPGLFLHDARAVLWDGGLSDTDIRFRPGRTYDDGHPNARGGYHWGKSLALLLGQLIPARPSPILRQRAERYDPMFRRQLLDNPLFTAGTGGGVQNGATGTAPASYVVRTQGGATASSVVASPQGLGNEVRLQCTFNALGDWGRLQQALDSTADALVGSGTKLQRFQAGDILDAIVQVRLAAPPSNLGALYVQLQCSVGGTRDMFGLYTAPLANWFGPDEACELTLKTRPFVVPAGTKNYLSMMLYAVGAGAGSADLYISQMQLRRRSTI